MSYKISKPQLTLDQRYALIKDSDSGLSQRELAEKYKISVGAVNKNLKRERDITDAHDLNLNPKSKRSPGFKRLELGIFRSVNLLSKQRHYKSQSFLEMQSSRDPTDDWRLSLIAIISVSVFCLESAGVDMSAVDSWCRALGDIVKDYNFDDIYNCDETGLLFRTMPTKSYVEKTDTVHGTKGSKERLTVLLCCNMSETDKCKPMVIGKSLRPRCFKHIDYKSLPVD